MSDSINYMPLEEEPQLMRIGGKVHAENDEKMCEEYYMKDIWCLHFYNYDADLWINGTLYKVKPFSISITPPFSHVKFLFRTQSCYHISSFFRYPIAEEKGIPFPEVMYLDKEVFNECYAQIHKASRNFPLQIKKAQVAIWNILWTLTDSLEEGSLREWKDPLPLDRAIQYIEQNFSSKIRITQVAEYAGVSTTHLSRLFNKRFAMTVIAYLRRKRVSEAVYLLTHTNLPIKEVAFRTGVEDLSHFYKIVQREIELTPMEIRKKSIEGVKFSLPLGH